ncbi:MAG: phosphodiester glycosidase family protein [Nostoc sp.]
MVVEGSRSIGHWVQEFDSGLTLQQEVQAMKLIGCHQAMNLDGGALKAFAANSKILVPAGRLLTNMIVCCL